MKLGGPVWHVSVMPRSPLLTERDVKRMARKVIEGRGDAALGEWWEWRRAGHLRRRLSESEALLVGPVVDVRRTEEAWRRAAVVGPERLAYAPNEVLLEELGESPPRG